MKVPVSWMKEFCPVDLTPEELADALTSRGAKVQSIVRPWERLRDVVVARVLDVEDHPRSDTLCVARVTDGSREVRLVVGVRNMRPGDLVPLAGPGATVPGLPDPLTARDIRGVTSQGMLCSPRELGISGEHQGILILPADAPLGGDVRAAFGLDEAVLDIEVTPNRPDLLSVVGVAREAAAFTGVPFSPPDATVPEVGEEAAGAATVEIMDLERCPRYLARVIRSVTIGPSPIRVQARLFAAGMRAVSNVVDATNYVLLETGQPLHPFDLDALAGPGIAVRRAAEGERFTTLDGVERTMTESDLMIADRKRSVAVAGVMGGAASEVSDGTRNVLLESAYFQPRTILLTARRLELRTEASIRFERGADPEAVPPAAARAAALMARWAGGSVLAGAAEAGGPPARSRGTVRPERASAILGYPVDAGEVREAFARLGMVTGEREGTVEVEVPSYRVDLTAEVDLIEEVVRVQGYDRVGSTLPGVRQAGGVPETYALRRRARTALVRAGLRETWSMSFASQDDLELMGAQGAVQVANPLAADQAFLRTDLTPGLLRALRTNLSRQVRGAALFEVGRVFRLDEDAAGAVRETERVGVAMTGPANPGYPAEPREIDISDARGAMETLLAALGVQDWSPVSEDLPQPGGAVRPWLHPARSAALVVGADREPAGVIGELHPRMAEEMDLPARVALAEFDLEALRRHTTGAVEYRDIPRFPPVHRDLAFMVDAAVPAGDVARAIAGAGGGLLGSVALFDVFSGGPIPEGKKSLAFAVEFRSPDRTLTDEETDRAVREIVEAVEREFGAELRSG